MDLFGEPVPEPVTDTPEAAVLVDGAAAINAEKSHTLNAPKTMPFCLGHEAVERNLISMMHNGRLPHAMIFSGPQGIGKATMAYRLIKFLLGEQASTGQDIQNLDVDHTQPRIRQIISGGHPDFMALERAYDATKNTYASGIPVSEVRKVPDFLRMTASYGGWRAVIVDDADTMNRNAQNAILKVLEEPPAKTVIILVAHRLGAMIPTIRSRSVVVPFDPLPAHHVETLLSMAGHDVAPEDLRLITALTGGSVGGALDIIKSGHVEVIQKTIDFISKAPDFDWPSVHQFADDLARKGQDRAYRIFRDTCLWLLLDIIRTGVRAERAPVSDVLTYLSLAQKLEICDNLKDHFAKVEYGNLDKRYGVLGAFMMICGQKQFKK